MNKTSSTLAVAKLGRFSRVRAKLTWSLGLLALAGVSAAGAATVTFTGATSSELTTPTNYSTGGFAGFGRYIAV